MSLLSLLLETTLKSSAVMLAALIAVACLRQRSAALRHWILSAAMVAALLTPILSLVTPTWHLPLDRIAPPRAVGVAAPARSPLVPAQPSADAPRPNAAGLSLAAAGPLVSTAWMLGVALSLLILIAGLSRLAGSRRARDGLPPGAGRMKRRMWRASMAAASGRHAAERSSRPARDVGLRRTQGDPAAERPGLERRAGPRGPVARASRTFEARRLADPDARRSRPRRLLVQPGDVDRRSLRSRASARPTMPCCAPPASTARSTPPIF